jgi:hypothetical protein
VLSRLFKKAAEPKVVEPCEHFWRVFGSTRIGAVTCEKCWVSKPMHEELDRLIVGLQKGG